MSLPNEQQWIRVEQLAAGMHQLNPNELKSYLSALAAAGEPPTVISMLGRWLELPPPAAPLEPGSVIVDRYTLKEKIGEGGMGSVWRARQTAIGRDVALKMIHPSLVTPELKERFVTEIELLGRLSHPGIVKIFDAGIHEMGGGPAIPFFAMELVAGVSLDKWAATRRSNRFAILQVTVALCEAVQSAHERQIVHRDLKPTNIVVTDAGQPVVLDFGIARLTSSVEGDAYGVFSGTPQYAAPEQHLGRDQDFRSGESVDVYAIGVIVFYALSGRRPFEFSKGANLTEMRRVVLEGTPHRLRDVLSDCPPLLDEIVSRAMRRDPADRFYSVAAFGRALRRALTRLNRPEETATAWVPAQGAKVPGTGWRLTKKIGDGGVGQVWLGEHDELLGERRVFKFCETEEKARTLKRELTLFRLLKQRIGRNPHFVPLHEVSLDEPPFYLMMDYSDASDLESWCAHQEGGLISLPEAVRMEIVAQVAEALQAAHETGILHRDIKPANLLVQGNVQKVHVLVADFGIGQIIADELLRDGPRLGFTRTVTDLQRSTLSGTMLYMAPEVLEGNPATAKSDLYSLGVVMWQLLIGNLSAALDPADWAARVNDPLLRADLTKCLAGAPEKRWPSAADLAASLRSLPSRRAAVARREAELAARERAAYRRGVARAAVVAGIVLALVTSLGWIAWKQRGVAENARGVMALEQASSLSRADLTSGRRERGLRLLDTAAAKVRDRSALRTAAASVLGMSDLARVTVTVPTNSGFDTAVVPRTRDETCRTVSHDGTTVAVARGLDGVSGVVAFFGLPDGEKRLTIAHKEFPWIPIGEPALLRFSPDDKLLAIGGAETSRHILLCDRTNGAVRSYIFVGSDPASCAWHRAGLLAVGCADSSVSLWNPAAAVSAPGHLSGSNTFGLPPKLDVPANDFPLQTIAGHRGPVRHVAFSSNGQWLASLDNVGYLRVHVGGFSRALTNASAVGIKSGEVQPFEFAVETRIDDPQQVTGLEWSSNHLVLRRPGAQEVFAFTSGELPAEMMIAPDVNGVAFSPDGGEFTAITLTDVHWLRSSPLEWIATANGKNPDGISSAGNLWLWPSGNSLVANRLALKAGEWTCSVQNTSSLEAAISGQGARAGVATANDGRVAAYYGRRVAFFDGRSGAPAAVSLTNSPGSGEFRDILWDARGELLGVLFSNADGPVHLESWSTSQSFPPEVRELSKTNLECRRVCTANRGALFLCRGAAHGLFYFDAASGRQTSIDTSSQARQNAPMSVTPDGRLAALVIDRNLIRLLKLPSGEPFAELHSQRNSELKLVRWDNSGDRIVAVTHDGHVQIWNLAAWRAWLVKHQLDT